MEKRKENIGMKMNENEKNKGWICSGREYGSCGGI